MDLIRTFDRDLEIELTKFFKEHPDTFLIVHFEGERAVWCKKKYNDPSCRFTDRPVDVTVVIGYFYGKLTVRDVFTSDAYTEQVASRAAEWAATGTMLGNLPVIGGRTLPTDWKFNLGIAYPSQSSNGNEWEIAPLARFQGISIRLKDVVYNPTTRKRRSVNSGTVYIQEASEKDFAGISEQLVQQLQQLASKE